MIAEQPSGTVEGSVTMMRQSADREEYWQCSRHKLGSRVRFWEQIFLQRSGPMTMIANRVTDEIFSGDDADEWFSSQIRNRMTSGFKITHTDGAPGPLPAGTQTHPEQTHPEG
jgi:hypothetical protein